MTSDEDQRISQRSSNGWGGLKETLKGERNSHLCKPHWYACLMHVTFVCSKINHFGPLKHVDSCKGACERLDHFNFDLNEEILGFNFITLIFFFFN